MAQKTREEEVLKAPISAEESVNPGSTKDPRAGRPVLEMKNVSKSFPGVQALDHVNLTVYPGTVHALMGENGAGKSTLMKCLFGIYSMDEGTILIDGKEERFHNPKEAMENGVSMVHQELNQALSRSVKDNLWLGRYPTQLIWVDERKMTKDTQALFDHLKVNIDPSANMGKLPVSQRQMVEIAKAVSYKSKIIVFDEPTSSLTETEVEHLFRIINELKEQGVAIIYISHKMDEIFRISDEITVMRDGKYVDCKKAEETNVSEIIKLMVGRELTQRFPDKHNKIQEVIFEAKQISGEYNLLEDVSFELHSGEILGVAGLDGSGRTELLETIFGAMTRAGGELLLGGQSITNATPKEAVENGFALLTEERRATGIFAIRDILNNTVIANLKNYKKFNFYLDDKQMQGDTAKSIDSLNIKTPSQKTAIRSLSGGNQQKVLLGRWLLTNPQILLLDEPTRGIDVGAKYEIYQLIIDLAEAGKGVIMVSSEMPELLGICDRIMVMSNGRVAGTVLAQETSQEEILTLAEKYM